MAFFEKITVYLKEWFKKLTGEQKRRLVLICTAAFAVLLTFSVIMSMVNRAGKKRPSEPERTHIRVVIPAEELFLPEEPDFLPGVLLDRDRRASWSEQDAQEYWQDPLRAGEEQWREKIEAAIDELLERVQ
jgi:hypothetical protein